MTIASSIISALTGNILGSVERIFDSYMKKEISAEEFKSKTQIAVTEEVEKTARAWADVAAKQFESLQATLRGSVIMQRAFVMTLFLQIFVILWYQVGVPAFELATGMKWPSPGVTLEWAYALVAAMIGAGPLILRRTN